MKQTVGFLITVCLLMAFDGCAQNSKQDSTKQETEYRKISAEEAKKMLDENSGAILLDVRTEAEHKEQRIPGSMLLPNNEIKNKAKDLLPDKDALILIYCRSGGRSANAAHTLIDMGYTNVFDMGGIINWPYETEKD